VSDCTAIYRPALSSERVPYIKKRESNCHSKKFKIWLWAPKGGGGQTLRRTGRLTVGRKINFTSVFGLRSISLLTYWKASTGSTSPLRHQIKQNNIETCLSKLGKSGSPKISSYSQARRYKMHTVTQITREKERLNIQQILSYI
jgi:hypothetical protein